ncbi:DUF7144 family membrane protein [Cellulomonas edaphi]|uniref:DUF7144 domain-containing protein n=1 Tax=Cellulomonas edaphi TaxID=3053468 RepID=A0ABT7S754_9CELL|nr:hypothetical protein [Cellulomons edaphi]MDM7830779.1 hypothetical protein [Cellulomons edaphi]
MAEHPRYVPAPTGRSTAAESGAILAGILLLMSSIMNIFQGISAIAKDDIYATTSKYLVEIDLTTWGWVHLVLGLAGVVAALGILVHAAWAQVVGIVVAGLAIVTSFAFLPHYPLWAVLIIAFNVFVIWALSVQLRD